MEAYPAGEVVKEDKALVTLNTDSHLSTGSETLAYTTTRQSPMPNKFKLKYVQIYVLTSIGKNIHFVPVKKLQNLNTISIMKQ